MVNRRTGAGGATARRSRAIASAGAVAVVAGLGVAVATPAAADEVAVSGVEFRWGINNESNNQGYFGYNFFSAGKLPSTGPNQQVQQANWKQADGNVSIVKKQADGSYAPAVWNGWTTTADGQPIGGPTSDNYSDHQIVIANGTGTVDVDANTADVQWDGDFTVVYYSGFTFWYGSDPHLTVDADGSGQLTATLGGYGADMNDPTKWEPLADTEVVLADLTGVEVTAEGIEVTPNYAGVVYDAPDPLPAGGTLAGPQVRTGEGWGSFPSSFVDFQLLTGQSSYWFTSGGGVDKGKPPLPLTVSWDAATPEPEPTPGTVTVSQTTLPYDDVTTVTVTGTGFDPSLAVGTRNPLPGLPTGLYLGFGRYANEWRPSEGVTDSSARRNASVLWVLPAESRAVLDPSGTNPSYAVLNADGSFSVTLQVDASALVDVAGNYGIYTYAAGGAVVAAYETATPLTFTDPDGLPVVVDIPDGSEEPEEPTGEFTWTVDGGAAAVSLGVATATDGGFAATGALRTVTVEDTRSDAPAWSISGKVGNFTTADGYHSFGGQALGWAPEVPENTVGAVAGDEIDPGTDATDGLKTSRTLASAIDGHGLGSVEVDAALTLLAPASTAPGSYTATLTLTALS